MSEDDLELIGEIERITGISVNTIRHWAKTGQLAVAELRQFPTGPAWCTTVAAVEARASERKKNGPQVRRKLLVDNTRKGL
jgi:hypothetical protein